MDLPKSPEAENETTERTPMSRAAKWMIAGLVVLLALMIVLHLSGVIGGSRLHRSAGNGLHLPVVPW